MCGIAGIYNFKNISVSPQLLKKMNDTMFHRGPDDDGYLFDGSFAMAMRRLSIIDAEHGKQPISNEDERYNVILNGEIYNYVELRKDLVAKGYRFKTESDTEVIVHLFEEVGPRCVEQLNGMFSFALWDHFSRELHIFRDRIGIKPLYYMHQDATFAFSSDLRSLMFFSDSNEIDYESLILYLGLAYVPNPRSIIKGIQKLPPASHLTVFSDGKMRIEEYWKINRHKTLNFSDVTEYQRLLLNQMRESVRLQLRSDVPVGTFLSGGLDSSTVVAIMAQHLVPRVVKTFSLGFESGYNELPYARLVAERYGTDHTEFFLSLKDTPAFLTAAISQLDEPIYDNSTVPTFVLSQGAKERGIKVILNGTGGDEIFGGYTRYRIPTMKRLAVNLPAMVRKNISAILQNIDGNKSVMMAYPSLMFFASGANYKFLHEILDHGEKFDTGMSLLTSHFTRFVHTPSDVAQLMYFDLKSYLVDDVLSLLDKMTMANSVEGRVPLLDHCLVELSYQMPHDVIFMGGELKGLLKSSVRHLLPDRLFEMPKRGFSGPTAVWVNRALKSSIYHDLIEDPIDFFAHNIKIDRLRAILDSSYIPERYCESIFALHVFSLWYRTHILNRDLPSALNLNVSISPH
ncbi:MAG: asparagine synthase (glutamine-hydrolyzing) [Planctomycetes bacterium]|nr:asparagine synthase (glutamine-hydrolyzing) [Planctomycetota bacterium]